MTEEHYSVETVVIGAGVVGLATARALAQAGQEVLVLESGAAIGEGTSSRNSEVVHAGIYYPEGSFKAGLCVRGRQQLYDYCQARNVRFRKCGKWIVATDSTQLAGLEKVQAQAACNGVKLDAIDGRMLKARQPGLQALAGLWSPETGIIDSHGLMLSLQGELEDAGGQLVLHSEVLSAESVAGEHHLVVAGDAPVILRARRVVNAAGLGAPGLARRWGGLPDTCQPRQWLAKGVYFSYSGHHPFESLIYPLPEPGGLGVHLTLDLAGQARFGPDVEWVEEEDYQVAPERAAAFVRAIRQWWPGFEAGRLQPAYAGIRPKLSGPGAVSADFRIDGPETHGIPGLVHLFGIESPGLTSCLAIADKVVGLLE